MTECLFPLKTKRTAYRDGCRCAECRAVKSEDGKRRPTVRRTCRACGGPRSPKGALCRGCQYSATPLDRVLDKVDVDPDSGCWVFTGNKTMWGYGAIAVGRSMKAVHRVVYAALVGPLVDGMHIDHLCSNRACCNPTHLAQVTAKENVRRSYERGNRK